MHRAAADLLVLLAYLDAGCTVKNGYRRVRILLVKREAPTEITNSIWVCIMMLDILSTIKGVDRLTSNLQSSLILSWPLPSRSLSFDRAPADPFTYKLLLL